MSFLEFAEFTEILFYLGKTQMRKLVPRKMVIPSQISINRLLVDRRIRPTIETFIHF